MVLPQAWTFRLFGRTGLCGSPRAGNYFRGIALPDTILIRHPEIDWAAVAEAGNVYRHEYDAVDESLMWHTIQHGLGALRSAANEELLLLLP
jgi:hypothetical protein